MIIYNRCERTSMAAKHKSFECDLKHQRYYQNNYVCQVRKTQVGIDVKEQILRPNVKYLLL